jgi:hypothetical protein
MNAEFCYDLADHVGSDGVVDIGRGVKTPMAVTYESGVFKSDMPDTHDRSLDELVYLDDIVLARLKGRDGLAWSGAETSVSAFNSSI